MITCDMRMGAIHAAHILIEYAPLLDAEGRVIATLKLPHQKSFTKPARIAADALALLRTRYRYVRARQLFHNRQEITVFLCNLAKNC